VATPPRALELARAAGEPMVFLSPHPDDAVLSCGALMAWLAGCCPVTVVTVFTAASPPPHTRAARNFLRSCAIPDALALFEARRAEDREVLAVLGASPVHLGYTDALFRRRTAGGGRLLPELVHRYPTYRFDIAKGRIARGDRALIDELAGAVAEQVAGAGAGWVFGPVGVGRHVDHLIVRAAAERLAGRTVVYYADFPYTLSGAADPGFLARHRLTSWSWTTAVEAKQELIRGYRTQADALFPGGRIPVEPETYYG
jgi:LmbE family N-acetylglucosaminyl deacetylase